MDKAFWIERWDKKQIGFHQPHINPYLQAHWARLGVAPGSAVLVPLCGKSRDMQWLRALGHTVIGIEISRVAIEEFFAEQSIQPRITQSEQFEVWEAPGYRLFCGDFFAIEAGDLNEVGAVFDRAALIALPADSRQRYAEKLQAALPERARMLLVTMTYPQEQMDGPPFSVGEIEVRRLYADWRVEKLQDEDVLSQADNARFKERGLRHMSEQVYQITKLPNMDLRETV